MNGFNLRLSFARIAGLICVLLLFASPVTAQEGIQFTAEVDRTAISTDDPLTLTVTVSGGYQQVGEPQLPVMNGFNVVGSSRSHQFSMINGEVSSKTVYTYRLQPTGPGTFTIDPVSIAVDGSIYQTEPITVQVTQGAAPTPTPEPAPEQAPDALAPSELAGQDFYVEAGVDNPTPVVGQQIIYRFYFYQAVELLTQPRLDWPSFSGFWVEELPGQNVYGQVINGRQYRITEVRRVLFPTAPGQITVEPARLTIPGDFFNRDVVLETQPVVVNVGPLPAGAPENFDGFVGQLEIQAWVEPVEGKVNEPLTLFVRVSGAGNLTTLSDPTESAMSLSADWRVYDSQITTNVNQDGDTIRGEKLFERLLVPKTDGELTIPSFSLAYFDPEASEYRQIETDPIVVPVAPGDDLVSGLSSNGDNKQDVTLLASDIRHIKAAPPSLATHRTPLLERPLYWMGWLLPLLAVVGTWAWDHRQRRLSSDVAYARAQRARRLARKQLAQARKQMRQDQDAAYTAVARALTDYLGDKFNLPSAGLTRDTIRLTLAEQAIPDDLVERALACLDWADSGRFAPIAAGRDAGELVGEAEAVVAELEKEIRERNA